MPNVAVTDGYEVVRTDAGGRYAFRCHREATMVYISLPSGFAFPEMLGMVQHFQPIVRAKTSFEAHFFLAPLNTDDTRHNFVVWADPQIASQKDAEELKQCTAADLRSLVAGYPAGTLFHGITCGDLVWDRHYLLPHYQEAVQMTGIPFFNVLGNHDLEWDAADNAEASAMFCRLYGPAYYSFNRGKVHYVVLNDVFVVGGKRRYMGLLPQNQLNWLARDLAFVAQGSTVVVCLHIPTYNAAAARVADEASLNYIVQNRQYLYDILAPYRVHFISGHTHVNEKWTDGNMMEHIHGAVCGAWWTGPVCADGTPNGYGVFEADGHELRWYHKATGFHRDYQMRLYHLDAGIGQSGKVLANVWGWDENWKVEWFEDDQPRGLMCRHSGKDPLAVQLLCPSELPRSRRFVEAVNTDHLFVAHPSEGARVVKVVATDRFGAVFQSRLHLNTPQA